MNELHSFVKVLNNQLSLEVIWWPLNGTTTKTLQKHKFTTFISENRI